MDKREHVALMRMSGSAHSEKVTTQRIALELKGFLHDSVEIWRRVATVVMENKTMTSIFVSELMAGILAFVAQKGIRALGRSAVDLLKVWNGAAYGFIEVVIEI